MRIILGSVLLLFGMPTIMLGEVPLPKTEREGEGQSESLLEILNGEFTNDREFEGVPLEAALDIFSLRRGLPVFVDEASFRADQQKVSPLELPTSLRKIRGGTVRSALKSVLEPIGASYILRKDHVLIVPRWAAYEEAGILPPDWTCPRINTGEKASADNNSQVLPWLELVQLDVKGQSVQAILAEVAQQSNLNLLIADEAKETAEKQVDVSFRNVAGPVALRMLAEMAGLGLIHQGNVYLLTTPIKEDEWRKRHDSQEETPIRTGRNRRTTDLDGS